jgi:hypothetical protein
MERLYAGRWSFYWFNIHSLVYKAQDIIDNLMDELSQKETELKNRLPMLAASVKEILDDLEDA